MKSKNFRYAAIALKILEKLLGPKFSVTGIENLPKSPILFVGNHFTRSETFFVPYLIYKYTGRQVRCLADSSLYHGALGKFLNSVGTISTKHHNRDNVILKDLVTGEYDWMIYPEGSMIKSKEIKKDHGFVNYTPSRVGLVRTGSAVLALKSELYRSDIVEAFDKEKVEVLQEFKKTLGLEYQESFRDNNTYIVPLNITYYPIRPGNNSIKKLVDRLVKRIPKQVAEELEIEGNILLGAEININFGKAENLGEYVKAAKSLIYQIPIIKNETKVNFVLKYFKHRLTNDFMGRIYSDIQVNLDHLFSAAIYHIPEEEIAIDHLKRVVYLSAVMIAKNGKSRLNHSILEENLFKIFLDEPHEEFDGLLELAKNQGMITQENSSRISINKSQFKKEYDFHEIRLENTLHVIANEFFLMEVANNIVKRNAETFDGDLRKRVFEVIFDKDLEIYENDYAKYYDEKFSKDKSIGTPFFLNSHHKTLARIQKIGILLCHGYKSSPKEVESLGQFLNGFGFKVYAVRLKGHGTAPINMKDATWQDWYNSVQRGYAALRNSCSKIVIVGFSTGGLLGLLSCAEKSQHVHAVITINAALKLLDIKTKMVPGINMWNEMLQKLHIEKGKFEFVDDVPENPAINYGRNYLKGVEQLGHLMEECGNNLGKITTPALIIQAKKDPVVNPASGKMIYEKINSKNKILCELDLSNHVIVNGENKEEVFEAIRKFLNKINLL